MFPEQLKKILQLIKKTGDRVVVFDPSAPDDSYVILDLDRYANMVDVDREDTNKSLEKKLQEDLLSDLLNSDKEGENDQLEIIEDEDDLVEDSIKSEKLTEDDLTDKINREISMWKNRDNSSFLGEENKPKKAWQIPPQVKNKAQIIE